MESHLTFVVNTRLSLEQLVGKSGFGVTRLALALPLQVMLRV